MTRAWFPRIAASGAVLGAALIAAAAIGDGSVVANPPVTIMVVTSGAGLGTATLANTTSTSIPVTVTADASCESAIGFTVAGGNPFTIAAMQAKPVTLTCTAGQPPGIQRCLFHATNTATNAALADFLAACEYAASPSLAPSTTLVDFGSVMIGTAATMTALVTNPGPTTVTELFLQTTDLDGNFRFSTPCNPDATACNGPISPVGNGSAATVVIECTPQAVGVHVAQLAVATDTSQSLAQSVTVRCTGTAATGPVLAVTPTTIAIAAPVEVTTGSATAVVHLANIGVGSLQITDVIVVGATADWTYVAANKCTGAIPPACSLASGEQTDLDLVFDPTAIGTRDASLLISYHDTLDRTQSIPLVGVGLGATLQLVGSQTMLDLGMVPVTRMSSTTFELANLGNRNTTAMLSMMPPTGPFSLSPATSAVVTPTATKSVTVSCAPTMAGVVQTMVTAASSDAFMSPPIVVTASCEGITTPLFATPTTLAFGEIRTAAGRVTRSVQLLSTAGPLTLAGAPQLDTPNANLMLGSASSPTTTATFVVTVDPLTDGDLADHIVVADTGGDTLRIPVAGRVVTASYTVPTALDVGTFCINQPTTASSLALKSNGTATIAVQQPALGLAPSPFQLELTSPSLYPSALPPGRSASIAVTPQRQSVKATVADTLTWTTDVEGKLTATTAIAARFVDQGGAIAPPALDFGKAIVHIFVDDGQRVMIQNCNATALQLDPPTIKAPFSIDSSNFPTMLNPNETATFSVGFHPTRIGVISQTLTISSPQLPNAPLEVSLVGEGVSGGTGGGLDAGPGSSAPGQTSLYACSCTSSGPGGGVPVALAMLWPLVPRRRRLTVRRRS